MTDRGAHIIDLAQLGNDTDDSGPVELTGQGTRPDKGLFDTFMDYKFEDGTHGFDYLDAAPVNLAAADVPPPMSEPLELASIPSIEKIVETVKNMV